jgi:hypothetical protein
LNAIQRFVNPYPQAVRRAALVGVVVVLVATSSLSSARPPDPGARAATHLSRFVALSAPPEYRRFGSPGMAAAATYAADVLDRAGYAVRRVDVDLERDLVDYSPGHEPQLVRLEDGRRFAAERVFFSAATGAEGVTCTVRPWDEVAPGDCGFVPFDVASPEWNNVLSEGPGAAIDTIVARGGVGAVVQGDLERRARLALRLRKPVPAVSAVVAAGDIVGRAVTLRSMGEPAPAVAHNVVAVRRPPSGAGRYLVLQGHLDGWFEAAADNAAGVAAVLAAAEALASADLGTGLLVAVYDAEEWGLLGSRAVAGMLASPDGLDVGDGGPPLHMGDLAAVVNLDAPTARASDVQGGVPGLARVELPLFSWRAMVFSEEAVLPSVFIGTMAAHGVLGLPLPVSAANPLNGGVSRSDTKWFHEAGVPVVWPVAGYPEYHTDADTMATVDFGDLASLTRATVALIERASHLPLGPVLTS